MALTVKLCLIYFCCKYILSTMVLFSALCERFRPRIHFFKVFFLDHGDQNLSTFLRFYPFLSISINFSIKKIKTLSENGAGWMGYPIRRTHKNIKT